MPRTQSANANRTVDAWPITGRDIAVATVSGSSSTGASTTYPPSANHAPRRRSEGRRPVLHHTPTSGAFGADGADGPSTAKGHEACSATTPSTTSVPPSGPGTVPRSSLTSSGAPCARPTRGALTRAVTSYRTTKLDSTRISEPTSIAESVRSTSVSRKAEAPALTRACHGSDSASSSRPSTERS